MDITEVRISLRSDAKLKAFASITLDNCFVVRGLKIIQGATGIFVAMPSRKRKDGEYQDIAHPINNDTRQWMEKIILAKYKEALEVDSGSAVSKSSNVTELDDEEVPPETIEVDKQRE